MTNTEIRAKQRRIHEILLNNSALNVFHNCINNTLDYEGVDITEPLVTLYEYFMTRLRLSCGLPVVTEKRKYTFILEKKPKVYISGRITGLSEKVYKNKFNSAELYLTGLGYDVVNPVAYDTIQNGTWEDYMRRDIKLLCGCDYIYLLEGWEASDGASLEKLIADNLKIETLVIKEEPNPVDENGMVV